MFRSVALCLTILFIIWLFRRTRKQGHKFPAALWIPLVWIFIIGTKPVSFFLDSTRMTGVDRGLEDPLVDKVLFVFLIGSGFVVLLRRRVNWGNLIRQNKWLFVYFAYLGLSVLWSDDSFVSFKRWFKDFGNVVVILVILTEDSPVEAVKAVLARFCYLILPLSVLVIKYYPEISRIYDVWTYRPLVVGLTTNKNLLGTTLFVCGVALFWLLIEDWKDSRKDNRLGHSILALMCVWLLYVCHSATAVSCTILSGGGLLMLRIPSIRNHVKRLGTYAAVLTILVVFLRMVGIWAAFTETFADVVGRDPTFHGRDQIWALVLSEDINPLIGTGFYSFWSTERNQRLSKKYYYQLGEAHNGYVETYLNSGLIGLLLLTVMIAAAVNKIKRDIPDGSFFAAVRLVFLLACGLYNVSESLFDRMGIIWFIMLLVMLKYEGVLQPQTFLNKGSARPLSPMFRYPAAVAGSEVSPVRRFRLKGG